MVEASPLSSVQPVGKPDPFTVSKLGLVNRPDGQKPTGVAVGVAVFGEVGVAVGVLVLVGVEVGVLVLVGVAVGVLVAVAVQGPKPSLSSRPNQLPFS